MSASNCPETPRQKMISMMYLVYTALLALNVSVQILDGYKLVEKSLDNSIDISVARNNSLEAQFQNALAQNPGRVKEWDDKRIAVNNASDSLYNFIQGIKRAIVAQVDGAPNDTLSSGGLGELNIPSVIWRTKYNPSGDTLTQGSWGIGGGGDALAGKELEDRIVHYREYINSIVAKDSVKVASYNKTFNTDPVKAEGGVKKSFTSRIFEDMPAIAAITMLTKYQNDVRNTQAEVIQWLHGQIDAGDFRVNKIQALAVPVSGYVLRGGTYEAQIILAATDSTKKPTITVNGATLTDPNGIYKTGCGSVGVKKYQGEIKMKKPDGTEVSYPFKSEYTVGEPTATISPDMLNVVYAGYDNPISVSVPGVAMSDVTVSFTNASSRKGQYNHNECYIVRPSHPGKMCDVTVTAKIGGKSQTMARKSFRIKALPPPLAFLRSAKGDFPGGKIQKANLLNCTEVVAKLDDDLLTGVKYKVFGFDMKSFDSMGNTVVTTSNSGAITGDMQAKMKRLAPGKTFYISGVKAQGPDGVRRTLPAVEIVIR